MDRTVSVRQVSCCPILPELLLHYVDVLTTLPLEANLSLYGNWAQCLHKRYKTLPEGSPLSLSSPRGISQAVVPLMMTPTRRDVPYGLHHSLPYGDVLVPAIH